MEEDQAEVTCPSCSEGRPNTPSCCQMHDTLSLGYDLELVVFLYHILVEHFVFLFFIHPFGLLTCLIHTPPLFFTYIFIYVCVYIYVFVYLFIYMCIFIFIYICVYIRVVSVNVLIYAINLAALTH